MFDPFQLIYGGGDARPACGGDAKRSSGLKTKTLGTPKPPPEN